jgi:hypothetical protein
MSGTERVGTVVLWLVLLLIAAWGLGLLGPRSWRWHQARAYGRRVGLPVVDGPVVARLARRHRFVLGGVAVGALASPWLNLAAVWVGLAAGAVADQLTAPAPAAGPRVAHATSTRLDDYVPRWVLGAAAAAATCVPVLAVCWLVAPRTPRHLDPRMLTGAGAVGLVVVAVGGLAISLALARLVVRRPQAAGTATELALDDAYRAQAVRDALQLTAAVSVLAGWRMSQALLEQDVDGVLRRVGGAVPLVTLLAIVVAGVLHEATGGARHWRSRLVAA